MTSMSQYNYVNTDVDISGLVRGPKGLRLDAKVSYRDGHAMLSVYGYWAGSVRPGHTQKVVLQRVFVPSDMPKAEKHRMLRTMCDLLAVKHGTEYALRSKLQ